MPAATPTSRIPASFALRNFDSDAVVVLETGRFRCPAAAALKGLKLSKADGQVREPVGLDRNGGVWTIRRAAASRENPSGWELDRPIFIEKTRRTCTRKAA